jgi:hypothetical protein
MWRRACAIGLLVLCVPTPSWAWGGAAHRFLMRRTIELLPQELRAFFDRHRDELILRVNDPDIWRTAGWEDDPNHFLDFGLPELGPFPFSALPRDYTAALQKFGMANLKRIGLLPWREAEEFGNLRRAFEGFERGAPFAAGDAVLFAAVAAHYIQDAHQPLHATNNYDGALSGQPGVHARFETTLFERYESKLSVNPTAIAPIINPRDDAFVVLLASHQQVAPLLAADREASRGRAVYDQRYYDRFFGLVRPVLEQQLSRAISATAAVIVGAWQQAGRPTLRTTGGPGALRPYPPAARSTARTAG